MSINTLHKGDDYDDHDDNNNNNIPVGVYLHAASTARAPTRNPTQERKCSTITIQIH